MNAFLQHHAASIAFCYSCFDRLLLNGYIRALQFGGSIVSFLRHRRNVQFVSSDYPRGLSCGYHRGVEQLAAEQGVDIVSPPDDVRRCDWVQPYYQRLGQPSGLAVILKCRERARVAACFASRDHRIEPSWRYVQLYYFYLRDAQLGRLFLRVCPYFPFDVQVCLNGHEWLAQQLVREGIGFRQHDNAFVDCERPDRLQQLADAFGPDQIVAGVEAWLPGLVPFFTPEERADGYRHRLFGAQAEYCHNAIFRSEAGLDRLFGRLLDSNRGIGHPDKVAVIFGRQQFRPDARTSQTEVKVTRLKLPVIKTSFRGTSVKQYVKGRSLLRTETSCFQLRDLSIPKDVKNLPRLQEVLQRSDDRYLEARQDVLASPIDRGQLDRLRQPTVSATGRRTPGLHLDDPRRLAVLRALTHFAYLTGQGCFRTAELLPDVQRAVGNPGYRVSQLRYDLGKLRGKDLVRRRPRTQRYELTAEGYRLAVLYQKLYHRVYAPLTASTLDPVAGDNRVPNRRKVKLDRLYEAVDKALRELSEGVGIAA
jgi:hypothetical protein